MSGIEVQMAFVNYYKEQRNRIEKCLDDIFKILTNEPEAEQIDKILQRLIKHYSE